jgi:RecB family endonuclease NucS
VDPDMDHAEEAIRRAIRNKEVLVIIGFCSVDYQGRSESRLTGGERLIIVKEDGALLVHRPTGYKPVNWQPSTSIIEVKRSNDKLIIMAVRDKPREIVWINLSRINVLFHGKLVDMGEFVMYMDEHEIRDILFENPHMIEDGLRILEKEKRIGDGYADLFGIDAKNRPVIIEIKRVSATRDAVLQLYSYVMEYYRQTSIKPRGILVAPTITSSAVESARKLGLEWKEINLQKLWRLKREKESRSRGTLLDYIRK